MTLRAIDKHRERIDKLRATYPWIAEMADEVEREVDGRYIELPVGDDGEALRIGDELECYSKDVLLNSLVWDGRNWYATETTVSSGWYPARMCRHKAPTVEDVISEAIRFGADAPTGMRLEGPIAEFAERIREAVRAG